jgi:glutaredoxin
MDPFAGIRDALRNARLDVYVSTWCWDCRRLKGYLNDHGIEYETVNISHDPQAAQRLETETGRRGVPFVLVDGVQWVAGYHVDERGRFNAQRFVNELTVALEKRAA